MQILITGGTGFIGRLLIEASKDDEFTVVTRDPSGAMDRFRHLNQVKNYLTLQELSSLDEFDAVINLAGEPIIDKRWTDKQKRIIETSRWDTTGHLVNCLSNSTNPPAVFISGSAIGYYGEQGDTMVTEDSRSSATDFSANLCREWEKKAESVADNTRLVILRTGIVLHPDFGALQRMILPFKFGLGGPIGNGKHYFSWIHWQDMIAAIQFLLTNEKASGPFNMTAPNPVTNRDFSKALGSAVGMPAIFPVPPFVLKLMLGEGAELLTVSQRVIPQALSDTGFEFTYTEVDGCLQSLLNNG